MRNGFPVLFGLMLLAMGVLALCFVPAIQNRGLGHNNDPGPRVFPAALATCLAVGGLGYLVTGFLRSRESKIIEPAESASQQSTEPSSDSRANHDALILLAAIAIYAAAMPWLGFALSTGAFATGMMLRLRVRWPLAIGVAVALVVLIHLLFVILFKVQLPRGVFA